MAGPQVVGVVGLKELQRDIRRIKDKELGLALKQVNKTLADRIVALALPHVPVRTGKLRASVKGVARQDAAIGKAGTPSRVPYAAAIHWGWRRHNIKPNPFLKNAADSVEREAVDEYVKGVQKVLDALRSR